MSRSEKVLSEKEKASLVAADHVLFNALSELEDVSASDQRSQLRELWASTRKLMVAADVLLEMGLIKMAKQRAGGVVDSAEVVEAGRIAPYITKLGRKIQWAAKWLRFDDGARNLPKADRYLYFMKRDRAFEHRRIEAALAADPNKPIGEIAEKLREAQKARQAAYFNNGIVEAATVELAS